VPVPMTDYKKKLIEVALPLEDINVEAAREKSIRHGHPSTLHLWWARRPLAACRAVLFAQLVDDPEQEGLNLEYLDLIDHFDTNCFLFPKGRELEHRKYLYSYGSREGQPLAEWRRDRLFAVIQQLVLWENIQNEGLFELAYKLIYVSCGGNPPAVYDPFSGGGSIPLEAQRLGLEAYGSDLNPVAVMIGKALIEIPPKFAGLPPVNPEWRLRSEVETVLNQKTWKGAQGLAEDVRYYGQWMRDRAFEKIGHLYPKVVVPVSSVWGEGNPQPNPTTPGEELTVIAWIWARTVASPNPALGGVHVPLAASFLLSSKKGKETWIEPIIAEDGKSYTFQVHRSSIPVEQLDSIKSGTKTARGANFTCLLSATPIVGDYIKAEGVAGRMGTKLMAVVAEGKKGRIYLSPTSEMEEVAQSAIPGWKPEQELPKNPRWFSPPDYGMPTYGSLFTNRQLVALTTFSDLVQEAREKAYQDAINSGVIDDKKRLRDGGAGAEAYADAIATYLAFAVDKLADYNSSICSWTSSRDTIRSTFGRQAIPMVWDYTEANPFSESTGNFIASLDWVWKSIETTPAKLTGSVTHRNASQQQLGFNNHLNSFIVSTDPPYYDNIGYADLSDFFYVWLRKSLKNIYSNEFLTLLTPKDSELVATPYRHGGKARAEQFFMNGMTQAIHNIQEQHSPEYPVTIYYAFKQSEEQSEGISSTGWETFLEAVINAGLSINGTLPLRTERNGRMIGIGTNALASSIVLVCRKQLPTAQFTTRGDFIKALKRELPQALKTLQHSNIAPVDMAQASIGPGMAIYTRYSKVMEADGAPLSVRTALQLINKALDEYLSEQEGEYDVETRFAITWFEQFGISEGDYGTAETLATARNVSVQGVVDAGVLTSKASKVRILRRDELPQDWNPLQDKRLCIWEATQHLIRAYEQTGGETAPAKLLNLLNQRNSSIAETARDLAYRLYAICDRKKWSEEALAYNSLVTAWSDIVIRADEIRKVEPQQLGLLP
jgi:putative DNA methylase